MLVKIAILAVLAGPSWAASRHQVADKDHLWGLAGKYYGNNHCWRSIYEANKGAIKDPHWIYPSQNLEIPDSPKCGSQAGPEAASFVETSAPVETAAPVEASAPVMWERPVLAEPVASIPPPAPAPAAKPVEKPAPLRRETLDDLAVEMPKGQSGGGVATPRVVFPKGWKSDGAATEEMLAERNDEFFAKMTLDPVPPGARFTVYRKAPRLGSDSDKMAVYVVKIATAEAVRNVKKKIYAFKLLKTGDAIMAGDLLKLDR